MQKDLCRYEGKAEQNYRRQKYIAARPGFIPARRRRKTRWFAHSHKNRLQDCEQTQPVIICHSSGAAKHPNGKGCN